MNNEKQNSDGLSIILILLAFVVVFGMCYFSYDYGVTQTKEQCEKDFYVEQIITKDAVPIEITYSIHDVPDYIVDHHLQIASMKLFSHEVSADTLTIMLKNQGIRVDYLIVKPYDTKTRNVRSSCDSARRYEKR
jgi:archaellum component FlaF (FlaF/FlaG flagellin family)